MGLNPLMVTADTTIAVVVAGTPLSGLVAGNNHICISDGNGTTQDEDPVTGLSVAAGVTLTLGLNSNGAIQADIYLDNDIQNAGTITVEKIAGTDNSGEIYIEAALATYNSAAVNALGGKGATDDGDLYANGGDANTADGYGGDANVVLIYGEFDGTVNTATTIQVSGGTGATNQGGSPAGVCFF